MIGSAFVRTATKARRIRVGPLYRERRSGRLKVIPTLRVGHSADARMGPPTKGRSQTRENLHRLQSPGNPGSLDPDRNPVRRGDDAPTLTATPVEVSSRRELSPNRTAPSGAAEIRVPAAPPSFSSVRRRRIVSTIRWAAAARRACPDRRRWGCALAASVLDAGCSVEHPPVFGAGPSPDWESPADRVPGEERHRRSSVEA